MLSILWLTPICLWLYSSWDRDLFRSTVGSSIVKSGCWWGKIVGMGISVISVIVSLDSTLLIGLRLVSVWREEQLPKCLSFSWKSAFSVSSSNMSLSGGAVSLSLILFALIASNSSSESSVVVVSNSVVWVWFPESPMFGISMLAFSKALATSLLTDSADSLTKLLASELIVRSSNRQVLASSRVVPLSLTLIASVWQPPQVSDRSSVTTMGMCLTTLGLGLDINGSLNVIWSSVSMSSPITDSAAGPNNLESDLRDGQASLWSMSLQVAKLSSSSSSSMSVIWRYLLDLLDRLLSRELDLGSTGGSGMTMSTTLISGSGMASMSVTSGCCFRLSSSEELTSVISRACSFCASNSFWLLASTEIGMFRQQSRMSGLSRAITISTALLGSKSSSAWIPSGISSPSK